VPLPWSPSKGTPAETVCWAVLAVVPIVCWQPQDPRPVGERACHTGGTGKSHTRGHWSILHRRPQEAAALTTAADKDWLTPPPWVSVPALQGACRCQALCRET
jgi:hypothetical protein